MKNKPKFSILIFPFMLLTIQSILLSSYFFIESKIDDNLRTEERLNLYLSSWLVLQKESAAILLKNSDLAEYQKLAELYSEFRSKADNFYNELFFLNLLKKGHKQEWIDLYQRSKHNWLQVESQIKNMERLKDSASHIRLTLLSMLLSTSYESELELFTAQSHQILYQSSESLRRYEYWLIILFFLTLVVFSAQRIIYYRFEKKRLVQHSADMEEMNSKLEDRVNSRTAELNDANKNLQVSLSALKETQDQLIQSERMAAITELVTGVAHEINTPAGVCLTAVTYNQTKLEELIEKTLGAENTEKTIDSLKEINSLIHRNVLRISDLVSRFKLVSSSEHPDRLNQFNVKELVEGIIKAMNQEIAKGKHEVKIICPETLVIFSYASAFSQIIRNLVLNSLVHGFEKRQQGRITIEITQQKKDILLEFSDNGTGISTEDREKIFAPFFTSKRKDGFTGLGLNMIFNLITTRLKGDIQCKSIENEGTTFIIKIPDLRFENSGNEF